MPLSFVTGTAEGCQTPEHDPEINSSSVIYSDFIKGKLQEKRLRQNRGFVHKINTRNSL